MADTNQLPEPELGYIQTDKSNQPAFSARQMRGAMKHTPQPTQATQAEVTDADIEQVLALAHSYADAKLMRYGALGIKEPPDPAAAFIELRRAILAIRPERVPMTDDERCEAYLKQTKSSEGHRSTFMRGVWAAEAHHGITVQAKKEGA